MTPEQLWNLVCGLYPMNAHRVDDVEDDISKYVTSVDVSCCNYPILREVGISRRYECLERDDMILLGKQRPTVIWQDKSVVRAVHDHFDTSYRRDIPKMGFSSF